MHLRNGAVTALLATGVGYKTNQTLAAMEVHTVADMRARPRHELERIFGATQGRMLHLLSMCAARLRIFLPPLFSPLCAC